VLSLDSGLECKHHHLHLPLCIRVAWSLNLSIRLQSVCLSVCQSGIDKPSLLRVSFDVKIKIGFQKMLIRSGQLGDAENLTALAMQVWLQTYATDGISSTISSYVLSEFTVARFQALLSAESSAVFVAEVGKNLVGYAVASVDTPCPEPTSAKVQLATLYIQEPFAGTGVGSLLLRRAESWAKQEKNSSVWLTANSKNARAIAFYTKHKYRQLGITYFTLGNEKHENLILDNSLQ
jgi:diamine N-acetyltransferase